MRGIPEATPIILTNEERAELEGLARSTKTEHRMRSAVPLVRRANGGCATPRSGRLILTVLGGLAEFERELIRARTGEGRARAKARGVHMGRPPKLTAYQRQEALARRDAGEPLVDIARTYGVSHSTISRL